MGHLPLPSSSTATVKRRRSAGRAREREEGGEETYPAHRPRSSPAPLPLVFSAVATAAVAASGDTAERTSCRPGSTGSTSVSRPALPPPPCITSFFCFCSFFFGFFFILLDQFLRRRPLPSLPSLPAVERSLVFPFPQLASPFRRSPRPRFRGRISSHWPRVCILKAKDTAVF